MSPVETLINQLLNGASYEQAVETSGFTRKEADNYLARHQPALFAALTKIEKQQKEPKQSIEVVKVSSDGQLLTSRPAWYTGQGNNKHVPVSHVVLLPTIKVLDSPGHLTKLPPGYVVAYKDWDKSNCSLDNLDMISRSELTRRVNRRRYTLK